MTEVLVQFETTLTDPNGARWTPHVCGRAQPDGLWEGWIEFEPSGPSEQTLRTPRESVQPNRDDLMYWAQGLTQTYLEGALQRARERVRIIERRVVATPRFDDPASVAAPRETITGVTINPFEVYQQGETILARQLAALSASRLRDIAVAYGFASRGAADGSTAETLASAILNGVRDHRVAR